MKRTMNLLIVAVLCLSMVLTACGGGQETTEDKGKTTESTTSTNDSKKDADSGTTEEAGNPVSKGTTYPVVEERITLKVLMTPKEEVIDINTNEAILYIEELTNIDLEIDVVSRNNAPEKISLMLASGSELPDIFLTDGAITAEQLGLYGEQGVFAPINDYIDDYAPNLKAAFEYNPLIEKQITSADGNIYSFARYSEGQHVMHSQKGWVNQMWLDELGMDAPTTIEEFRAMLEAFKANDLNGNGKDDEIPMIAIQKKWRTDLFGFIMQPFVPVSELKSNLYSTVNNGTIESPFYKEGMKDGVEFLRGLYADGLLDEEAFTLESNQAKTLTSGPDGNRVGFVQAGALGPVAELGKPGARDEFVALEPLKSVYDGERRTPFFNPDATNRLVISSTCENIEAAVRLGDLFMTDPFTGDEEDLEIGLNVWYGPNGWKVPDEGVMGLNGEEAWYEWTFSFSEPTNLNFANLGNLFGTSLKKGVMATLDKDYDPEKVLWEATEDKYEPHSVSQIVPKIVVSVDVAGQYGETKQILEDYMASNLALFVMGSRDLSEWDTFIDELDTMGLKWYIEETQKAYDAMYK